MRNLTLFVGFALVLVGSSLSVSKRFAIDAQNRTVGLGMDLQAIHDMAAASGRTTPEALRSLRDAGLTMVTMSGDTLGELLQRQELAYDASESPFLVVRTPETAKRIRFGLSARYGDGPWNKGAESLTGPSMISVAGIPSDSLTGVNLGLNPADAAMLRELNLQIVARHGNPAGATPRYIGAMLERSKKLGADVFLPEGDQALGMRDLLKETAEVLADLDMSYASPEFTKIAGDATLSDLCQDRLVRLHSIQQAEIDKMPPDAVADRFARAFRERNMRLLLLRPISYASDDPVSANAQMIETVRKAIVHEGGKLGRPAPFPAGGASKADRITIALGTMAVGFWMLLILGLPLVWRLLGALGMVAIGAGPFVGSLLPLAALGASILLPVAGYLWLAERLTTGRTFGVIGEYAALSVFSLAGGLGVNGLLNDRAYYLRVDQFAGVKLSVALPILLVGLILLLRWFDWRRLLQQPISWGNAVLGGVVLGALGLMVLRTGNDNPAAVSGFELKLRDLLDQWLYTRPRTKEFLIGHPATIVGLGMLLFAKPREGVQGPRSPQLGWGTFLLVVGAMGQTSIVNTLCHLHTPTELSLARIGIGWVLGGILGGLLWALLRVRLAPSRG